MAPYDDIHFDHNRLRLLVSLYFDSHSTSAGFSNHSIEYSKQEDHYHVGFTPISYIIPNSI